MAPDLIPAMADGLRIRAGSRICPGWRRPP